MCFWWNVFLIWVSSCEICSWFVFFFRLGIFLICVFPVKYVFDLCVFGEVCSWFVCLVKYVLDLCVSDLEYSWFVCFRWNMFLICVFPVKYVFDLCVSGEVCSWFVCLVKYVLDLFFFRWRIFFICVLPVRYILNLCTSGKPNMFQVNFILCFVCFRWGWRRGNRFARWRNLP